MIFVLDYGFGELNRVHYMNEKRSNGQHGRDLVTVIQTINPGEDIYLYDLGKEPTTTNILEALRQVNLVDEGIVCMTLTMLEDKDIERVMIEMSSKFDFIVAAGNAGKSMEGLIPCGKDYVTTVGSLNKSNRIANHNNKGNIDVYAPGTNIDVNGHKVNGTSIATAIYTGYYSVYFEEAQEVINEEFSNIINRKFTV